MQEVAVNWASVKASSKDGALGFGATWEVGLALADELLNPLPELLCAQHEADILGLAEINNRGG